MAFAARRFLLGVAVATTTLGLASAQQEAVIGETVCSCSPSSYTFSFNFSATCESSTLVNGLPGLNDTGCLLSGGGENGADTLPVSLASVLITDLDRDLESILSGQEANLTSTDTIVYNTFTSSANFSATTPLDIPRGLAMIMTGVNAMGEVVQLSIALIFTNECDVFPIISPGDTIGWLVVDEVTAPPAEFCPLADTMVATMAPSSMPQSGPTDSPSGSVPAIGQTVCACQPQSFTISLNLTGDCEATSDLMGSPGIDEVVCSVLDANDIPVFDLTPVSVSMVMITELDQTLGIEIAQLVFEGDFASGDTFDFQGFVASGGSIADATGLPGGLLFTIKGVDANGNVVENSWVVDFSNECGISGVIPAGLQVGWVVFDNVDAAPESTCMMATDPPISGTAPPTMVPGVIPTPGGGPTPSDEPSDVPSDVPSVAPDVSDAPSDTPSDVPSDAPSDVPSDAPSDAPSDVPSDAPSDAPSDIPSDIPTRIPTPSPTVSLSAPPSAAMDSECEEGYYLYEGKGKSGKGKKSSEESSSDDEIEDDDEDEDDDSSSSSSGKGKKKKSKKEKSGKGKKEKSGKGGKSGKKCKKIKKKKGKAGKAGSKKSEAKMEGEMEKKMSSSAEKTEGEGMEKAEKESKAESSKESKIKLSKSGTKSAKEEGSDKSTKEEGSEKSDKEPKSEKESKYEAKGKKEKDDERSPEDDIQKSSKKSEKQERRSLRYA